MSAPTGIGRSDKLARRNKEKFDELERIGPLVVDEDPRATATQARVLGPRVSGKVEKFKELAEIQRKNSDMLGPGGPLGAVTYSDDRLDAFRELKRQQASIDQDRMLVSAFDESDHMQARQLHRVMPHLSQSRAAVLNLFFEQQRFCADIARRPPDDVTPGDMLRMISILGGAEQLIPAPVGTALHALDSQNKGNNLFGLLSFFDHREESSANKRMAQTQAHRKYLAQCFIIHFPRYLTGDWDPSKASTRGESKGPDVLLQACEKVCQKHYTKTTTVIDQVMGAAGLSGGGIGE